MLGGFGQIRELSFFQQSGAFPGITLSNFLIYASLCIIQLPTAGTKHLTHTGERRKGWLAYGFTGFSSLLTAPRQKHHGRRCGGRTLPTSGQPGSRVRGTGQRRRPQGSGPMIHLDTAKSLLGIAHQSSCQSGVTMEISNKPLSTPLSYLSMFTAQPLAQGAGILTSPPPF